MALHLQTSPPIFPSWDPNHPNPCNWTHITCNSNGSVSEFKITSISLPNFPTPILTFTSLTTLIISNSNLTGPIPPSISNLSSLIYLDLSQNSLTGTIPPELGQIPRLRSVYLSSNSLVGPIPPEFANCSTLEHLEFVDNGLSGPVPAELGRLRRLKVFRAGGNSGIRGDIPAEIARCEELVFLGLADTSVSESDLRRALGGLAKLKRVLAWKNSLSGAIPESFGNSTDLIVVDLSLNAISGSIPASFARLVRLEMLLLSYNNISGSIPPFIGNLSALKQLELDNNRLTGEVPIGIGRLKQLTQFFARQNKLHGRLPEELAGCEMLESLDLSRNELSGPIPRALFGLKNLTELLLISNSLDGGLAPMIGECSALVRLRLGTNRLSGSIPRELVRLKRLNFLELSKNRFSGEIPPEIGECGDLEMVDLRDNALEGLIPGSFGSIVGLNVLDLSQNSLSGPVPDALGGLRSLNKLILRANRITGPIPMSLAQCKGLQLLDLSDNRLAGLIPVELGGLDGLDILLNLSWNSLSGPIPDTFSGLLRLASLDVSHNALTGRLDVLGHLGNLVLLNVSFNNFSGLPPDTPFFRELPESALSGNEGLCVQETCSGEFTDARRGWHRRNVVVMALVLCVTCLIVAIAIFASIVILRARMATTTTTTGTREGNVIEITPFQKLDFSVDEVLDELSDLNIVGRGSSGVVYRVVTRSGRVLAVKKLFATSKGGEFCERDAFTAEVKALGSIRHKNIVRLLCCCANKGLRLLVFDYMINGSLDGLLHEKKVCLDWDQRYKIVLGAAQGLAYLHHDCVPRIVHRDIKANNILVGGQFEAYLADFGLARKLVGAPADLSTIAGSYGYIAPETHIIDWVRRGLRQANGGGVVELLDERLRCLPDASLQEMAQALGVVVLCVNPSPVDRPTMKDVAAMLREIRHDGRCVAADSKVEGGGGGEEGVAHCSSFRSSEPLMGSPTFIC
ncbi:Receptor-like protein kinase 2 [Acorus calamus]|uniref:non-specific serine/threonine protein kinase n=1 Tax=Acorus calamus TaxID=4465 RepID=A0AAV9CH75_ACOCL|nr:Receptor-like protein kinase 2 [Acorus calamus]